MDRVQGQPIRRQRSDVIGEVNVFGETTDNLIALRQGRSAFEDEVSAETRTKKHIENPNQPNIFVQQMDRASRSGSSDRKCFAPVT